MNIGKFRKDNVVVAFLKTCREILLGNVKERLQEYNVINLCEGDRSYPQSCINFVSFYRTNVASSYLT